MSSTVTTAVAASKHRPWYSVLYIQVLIAIAVGIALGHYFPKTGVAMKPLGDAFIALIRMMIGHPHCKLWPHQHAHRPQEIIEGGPKPEVSIHKRQFRGWQSCAARDQDHRNVRHHAGGFQQRLRGAGTHHAGQRPVPG